MNVGDLIAGIKAQTQYGDPTSTSDTQTGQILAALNLKAGRIWAKWDWPWVLEELAFAITTGQTRFLVASKSGNLISRILDLLPQDQTVSPPIWGPALVQVSRREFYSKYAQTVVYSPVTGQAIQSAGLPLYYVNLGFDPAGSGKWRIEVAPQASQAFTMGGWARKLRVPYTIADVQSNNPITFFPADVIDDVLNDGVLSVAYRYAGQHVEADRREQMFEASLNQKVQEQVAAAEDDTPPTSPPNPERYYRIRMRNYAGTRVY